MSNYPTGPVPYGAPPPPPPAKSGCSPGCKNVAIGCTGMILGSLLTIAVEVALVIQGVSAVSDFFSRASGGAYDAPRSDSTVDVSAPDELFDDPMPKEFNGVPTSILNSLCGSSSILTSQQEKGCEERDAFYRQHGAEPPRLERVPRR